MINRIERKIQRLLTVEKKQEDIFDELVVHLFQKKLSDAEKKSIFNFGFNSGLYQELLATYVEAFHEKIYIPWDNFILLLENLNIKPSAEAIESILKGARRQEQTSLLATNSWGKYDSRFDEIKKVELEKRNDQFNNRKEHLLEKVEFYRSQRLVDEEKRALKVLLRMFPEDKAIHADYARFEKDWAREVIARNYIENETSKFDHNTKPPIEEQKLVATIAKGMEVFVKAEPNTAYNFAIGLKFMGHSEVALKTLALADDSWETDWLKIELFIDSGRFVDCLNYVHQIELTYSNNPETTFAATYARAKALYGLGQEGPAIDLLQSIVSVRPNYRSAYTLMTQWAGDL